MSGGEFNYQQSRINDIADAVEFMCSRAWFDDMLPETRQEFLNGVHYMRKAFIYAQRIDWLISGDDNENSFHERLAEELGALNRQEKCGNCCFSESREKCPTCGQPSLISITEKS